MSTSIISVILGRIAVATPQSAITVFASHGEGVNATFEAVFTDTVMTQARIALGEKDYIGTFDRTMNPEDVRAVIVGRINGG